MMVRVVQKLLAVRHVQYRTADFHGSIGKELAGKCSASPDTQTVHVNASSLTKCHCSALTTSLQAILGLQLMSKRHFATGM